MTWAWDGAGGYGGVERGVWLEAEVRVPVVVGWGEVADGSGTGGGRAPAGRALVMVVVVVVTRDVVVGIGIGVEAWHVGWFDGDVWWFCYCCY